MRKLIIAKIHTHSFCWKITFAHFLIEDIHTVFKSRYTMTHVAAIGVETYWSIWIASVLASFTIIQIYHVQRRNNFTLDIAWCTQIPFPLQFSKLTYLSNFHQLTIRIQVYICSQSLPPCSSNIHYLDDNCVSVPHIHFYLLIRNSKNTPIISFTIIQIYHVQQRNKFTLDIAWCTQISLPL